MTASVESIQQSVEECQGLVRSLALKVHRGLPRRVDLDDLIGYGQVGLVEAANEFDGSRGTRFATFAYYRIRGAIYDGLAALLGVLASGLYGLLRGRAEARYLLAGVLVCLAGAYVQMARLIPHRLFNHNDLFHVVLVIGSGLLFEAGRRFGREATPAAAW